MPCSHYLVAAGVRYHYGLIDLISDMYALQHYLVAAGVSRGLIDLISDMYALLTLLGSCWRELIDLISDIYAMLILPGSCWCVLWVDRFDQ